MTATLDRVDTLVGPPDERPSTAWAVAAPVRHASRRRALIVGLVLAAIVVGLFAISVGVGDLDISIVDMLRAMVLNQGERNTLLAVREWRLPRTLTGLLVGSALGCSGAVFQSLARNPLASPDIIGISHGATAVAVYLIIFTNVSSHGQVAVGALVGGLAAAAVIYVLAYRRGLSSYKLVLIGIGISAMLSAVTSYLLTRADQFDAMKATVWMTGSLHNRGWEHVRPLAIATAVLLPALLALAPRLRMLQLGDEAATGLGLRVERSRGLLIAVAVGFASIAAASAGPIAFVAFVAAPIARRLTRRPLTLLPAALVGMVVVLGSDLVARRLFAPTELPVGVVTGLVGAPYLLWLLARANTVGRGG